MRMDGKLIDQGARLLKIEEKLAKLENEVKEKEQIPSELTVADSSKTPSAAPAQQHVESLPLQAEGFASHGASYGVPTEGHELEEEQPRKSPSPELQDRDESDQGTEETASDRENTPTKPQPQLEPQPFPPHFEEVSIMGLFQQMVREEQVEK